VAIRHDESRINGLLEKCGTYKFDDLDRKQFTLNTNPGMPYVRMGFKTKDECYEQAVLDAKRCIMVFSQEVINFLGP